MRRHLVEYSFNPDTGKELLVWSDGQIEIRQSQPRYFEESLQPWHFNSKRANVLYSGVVLQVSL